MKSWKFQEEEGEELNNKSGTWKQ